jgi:cell division protein FtsX
MAGIVVKARFPRRRMVRTVVANLFRYLFGGAVRNWIRNIGGTAPALGSMTLLLLLTGLVGLCGFAIHNLDQLEAGQAAVLHVYISDAATSAEVDSLWDRLAKDGRVASVDYTTKAQALLRAQHMPGLPQLADASDSNPFPASLDVHVKSVNDVAAIDAMVRYDLAVDPVYPTSYDKGAYQRIQTVLLGIAVAGFAFLGLLGFVAVTVTINSIRSAIHAGALAGAAAGLVTFGLSFAGITAASNSFTQFAPGVTVAVAAVTAALVFATGLGLGSGASMIGVRRHMES